MRLIGALLDGGGLSVVSARNVLEAIDSAASLLQVFNVAQHAVSATIESSDLEPVDLANIDALLEGWHVSPENPGRLTAARVHSAFRGVGQSDERGWFARYAKAETVVVGTVLGDALISGRPSSTSPSNDIPERGQTTMTSTIDALPTSVRTRFG